MTDPDSGLKSLPPVDPLSIKGPTLPPRPARRGRGEETMNIQDVESINDDMDKRKIERIAAELIAMPPPLRFAAVSELLDSDNPDVVETGWILAERTVNEHRTRARP